MKIKILGAKIGEKEYEGQDTKKCFDKKKDTKSVCASLVNTCFGQADRIKMSKKNTLDLLEVASYVSLVNLSVYIHEVYKRALKENIPADEILGEFQLSLKESWDLLAKHPMGRACFNTMRIEDIINIDEPSDLLLSGGKVY